MKTIKPSNDRQVQPVLTTSSGAEPPYMAAFKKHIELTAFGFPFDLRENDFQAGWYAKANEVTPQPITKTSPHMDWWESLSEDNVIQLTKDYAFYGHDEGITERDIKWIWACEDKPSPNHS